MSDAGLTKTQAAILALLIHNRRKLLRQDIAAPLLAEGIDSSEFSNAIELLLSIDACSQSLGGICITPAGERLFLAWYGTLCKAIGGTNELPHGYELCPSLPWITTVQTEWIEAISINYRVDPEFLNSQLPDPIRAEIWKGSGWIQVLMSSLRDMRPQKLPSLFGVNFYQISYRAAVQVDRGIHGIHRGGYFLRSETNNEIMRLVGNSLTEFKYHEFKHSTMTMNRMGNKLIVGSSPRQEENANLVGIFHTTGDQKPPPSSSWSSLEELQIPLVDCYDALAVDRGYIYVLSIDRGPWNATFSTVESLYCGLMAEEPFAGHVEFDSVLHIPACKYYWRPLTRYQSAFSIDKS